MSDSEVMYWFNFDRGISQSPCLFLFLLCTFPTHSGFPNLLSPLGLCWPGSVVHNSVVSFTCMLNEVHNVCSSTIEVLISQLWSFILGLSTVPPRCCIYGVCNMVPVAILASLCPLRYCHQLMGSWHLSETILIQLYMAIIQWNEILV